jgi:hypothetical protein
MTNPRRLETNRIIDLSACRELASAERSVDFNILKSVRRVGLYAWQENVSDEFKCRLLDASGDDITLVLAGDDRNRTADRHTREAKGKARGVTQVVVAGVATRTGVEATARQA